jgi:hypothetical protein
MPASEPSPELAPKSVPQLDAKVCLLGENIYETGVAMPASEPSLMPAPLPSPELAPKPVPQLDGKLSSPAENVYGIGVAMPASELSPMPASEPSPRPDPLPGPELAPKPVPQLDAKLSSKHKSSGRAWLCCAKCGMRELVELDETQVQAMRKLKGVMRSCPACGATTLWRRLGL